MEKKNRIYVDVHVIQTVPPSCINRDDTGSPKTAVYGGVQRARVSSQSWKRAVRYKLTDNFQESELGLRTKKVVDLIAQNIEKIEDSLGAEESVALAKALVENFFVKKGAKKDEKIKLDKETNELDALFFIGAGQAYKLAEFAINNKENLKKKQISSDEKKEMQSEVHKYVKDHHSVDIALFGRMMASNPDFNSDACSQIAHSISTHRVDNEYDYFTALDDMAEEGTAGAAMIDVTEFNSATLYRYATVAVHELYRELGSEAEITVKAVNEFIKAFVTSMPTGKQNSFANRTLPEAVLVTLRTDQPINLVGAFEMPVKAGDKGYSRSSVDRLTEYADKVYDDYGAAPAMAWTIGFEGNGEKTNMSNLSASMEENLQKYFAAMAQE